MAYYFVKHRDHFTLTFTILASSNLVPAIRYKTLRHLNMEPPGAAKVSVDSIPFLQNYCVMW